MQYTENYQFRKPVIGIDVADVKDINFNSDRADTLIHNTQISLAPAYDLNETYDTGDVVMYETLMYKCKADNTTGAWDASKWERTTAGEEGAGGGGGTTVVPNPVGTPTDTLDTIQIGNTIYDIEGSGGSGKGYETTLIYDSGSNTAGAPTGQDVSLLDNLSKYDLGLIIMSTPSDRAETPYQSSGQVFFDTSYALIDDNYHQLHWAGYGNRWIQIKFTDTTFRITGCGGEDGGHTPNVYKIYGIKYGGGGNTAEIIPITAGDDTAIRTFTFSKTPKFIKFYWGGPVISGGWASDAELVWGQPYMNYRSKPMGATISQVDGGINSISYGADGKSLTITGGNAFGAFNTSNGSGLMFVDYGDGGGTVDDISDMTWTLLDSTTATSSGVAIPSGTKYLVLTAELGGYVSMVAKESIANIEKLATVASAVFNQGYEYADIAGNHTTISMSVNNNVVTIKSGYNTVTAKVYAVS